MLDGLSEYPQTKWPTWSNDGRSIVFERYNGPYSLLTRLTAADLQVSSFAIGTLPGLSSDGTQVVMKKEDPEKLIPVPGQPRVVRQRDVQAALTERSVLYQLIPGQRIRR